jgi:protein TilB
LRKLDLTVNFIDVDHLEESVIHLKECPFLAELYDIHYTLHMSCQPYGCHCLRYRILTGNPCTTFAGYRLFVVAHLPKLTSLDGTPVMRSEILEGKQELSSITERLRVEAKKRADEKATEAKATSGSSSGGSDDTNDDNDEQKLYGHSPEARLAMHRNMEAERKRKADAESGKGTAFEKPKDMIKEVYSKLNEKATVAADGTRPSQRNTGRVEFRMYHDEKFGHISVEIGVPRYLDTSEIDVDIHPTWLQVIPSSMQPLQCRMLTIV